MAPILGTVAGAHSDAPPAGRVLIADDYPDCASSLAILLGMDGYVTETVGDGPGVLPAADRFAPDVVVLDLMLPGCDGEEVLRGLLTLPAGRRPRVIVSTGYGDAARRNRLAGLGIDAFLLKPADPAELISCVRRACRDHTPH